MDTNDSVETRSESPPTRDNGAPMAGSPARLHMEVLDRRARLRMRTRIDELPCVIGRSYGCTVVLDDRFVSPEHIAVRRRDDGAIVVEDLDSTNGTYDVGTGKRVAAVEVRAGTAVRIGQTLLRFHTADEAVEPALLLPGVFAMPRWSVPLAFAVVFVIFSSSTYLETYSKLTPGPFVFGAVALAVALLSWAGTWALLSRVLQHQSYLAEHCVVICSFVSVYILAGWGLDYYIFAFAAERSAELLEWILPALLFAALFYGHLRFCSTLSPGQLIMRTTGFAGSSLALVALVVFAESFDPDWTAMATFRGGLKPPAFRLVASEDLDQFFAAVEDLKAKVDAGAEGPAQAKDLRLQAPGSGRK